MGLGEPERTELCQTESPEGTELGEGAVIGPVRLGSVAHGGHCVARHDNRVIFVRHALPGELVRLRLTDTSKRTFWRADAIEVLEASPDRVAPACPVSGPGGCGGCDFQHVRPAVQRALKAAVIREQLQRLAGITWEGAVEEVAPLRGWRTRMRYVAGAEGLGMRAYRSHRVVTLPGSGCLIAAAAPPDIEAPPGAEIHQVAAADREVSWTGRSTEVVTERAAGRSWTVAANGFWQVHPAAADTLVGAVSEALEPKPGETALDLYCGVGLFAGALADAGVKVWGVESERRAVAYARRNVANARFRAGRVQQQLARLPERVDLVVLDPPRTGAGRAVIEQVCDRRPRAIAYVACDPAALATDLATACGQGREVVGIRAFDLFPFTHHVECVALLH